MPVLVQSEGSTHDESNKDQLKLENNSTSLVSSLPNQQQDTKETYIYPIDAGIIRCICGFDDDDGFTIQCEKCNAWQHAQCVNIADEKHVPDIYYCDLCCDPAVARTYDREQARQRQLLRMQQQSNPDGPDDLIDGNAMDVDSATKTRRAPSLGSVPVSRKRKPKRTKSGTTTRSTSPGDEANERAEALGYAGDAGDVSGEYTSAGPDSGLSPGTTTTSRKRKRMTVENNKKSGQADNHEIEAKYAHSQSYLSHVVEQAYCQVTDSKTRNYLSSIADQVPELPRPRKRSAANASASSRVSVRTTSGEQQGKQKFGGFTNFAVYAATDFKPNDTIFRATGKLILKQEYKANPINQYMLFGCPKAGTLFTEDFDIVLDGRCVGNEATFIRRSCKPNIRVALVKADANDKTPKNEIDDDHDLPEFQVAIMAKDEPISQGDELCVDWEWDPNHPIRKVSFSENEEELTQDEKLVLKQCLKALATRDFRCRCSEGPDCKFLKARKYIDQFFPSERAKRHSGISAAVSSLGTGNDPNSVSAKSMASIGSYSAREERKLKETIMLIDKLERKSKPDSMAHSTETVANVSASEDTHDNDAVLPAQPAEQPSQDEPVESKPPQSQQQSFTAVPRHRLLLHEFRTRAPGVYCEKRSSYSGALGSVGLSVTVALFNEPNRQRKSVSVVSPSTSNQISPVISEKALPGASIQETSTSESSGPHTTTTSNAPHVSLTDPVSSSVSGQFDAGKPSTDEIQQNSNAPSASPPSTSHQSSISEPSARKSLKRLTFADYKKLQRPSVSGP